MQQLLEAEVKSAVGYLRDKKRFEEIVFNYREVLFLSETVRWKEIVYKHYPQARFVIMPSVHPGNKWSLISVTKEPSSREVLVPIKRPEWFDNFIHQGKWIAGSDDTEELLRLADYSIKKQYGE
jgi:uncharacterized UPF0160 family protein